MSQYRKAPVDVLVRHYLYEKDGIFFVEAKVRGRQACRT